MMNAQSKIFPVLRHEIQLAVRDLKIWTVGIAIVLFTALVAVRFFVH